MIQDLLFNEVQRKKITVTPKEGSVGSNYKIAVRDAQVRPGGDSVVIQDGQKFLEGGVSEGNRDKYTVTGEPEIIEGDVNINTQSVVETERSVAWGILGLLFAGVVALGLLFKGS